MKTQADIHPSQVSHAELVEFMHKARAAYLSDPGNTVKRFLAIRAEYNVSKYVRRDNTSENAMYLGYLDTKELYPDFNPRTFSAFVDELLAGRAKMLYQHKSELRNMKA